MRKISIGNKKIGTGEPCFIIAEAGVNHNGSLDRAKKLIDAACESGADAVKFQTLSADQIASRAARKADYQMRTTDSEESQYAMLKKLELRARNLFRSSRNMQKRRVSSSFHPPLIA